MSAARTVPLLDRDAFVVTLERLYATLRRAGPADLSLTSASTLHTLDRSGPRRLTDLAAREGLTQPGMTQLVSRLERDGLARRDPDPADRRAVLVAITPKGREVVAHRRRVRAERLAELIGELPPADEAALAAAMPALDRLADLLPPA